MGNELTRQFSKESVKMTNTHMKRCPTLLIIREMQIKTSVRYHLTLIRKVVVKKNNTKLKCIYKCWIGANGNPHILLVGK